jgi:hypothetical protein
LDVFHQTVRPLPGIQVPAQRDVFLEQVMESIHRVQYIARLLERDISVIRADPSTELFDPIKAAALHNRNGRHDEACWLVFLFTHFGRSLQSGWRLARDIYGSLGDANHWDWARTSRDPAGFRSWLAANQHALRTDGIVRRFGNHRKRQSLDAHKATGTGAAVESYVAWVAQARDHFTLFDSALAAAGRAPRLAFDDLYRSMAAVSSFGRLAKFDYLTMIGKLHLAAIEPGCAYLVGATGPTGPLKGARLLFFGNTTANATPALLDAWLIELESHLGVGMQVLEDSLCNWQKNPTSFIRFRG